MTQAHPPLSPVLDSAGRVVLLDWSDLSDRVNPQTASLYDLMPETKARLTRMKLQGQWQGGMMVVAARQVRRDRVVSSRCRDAA
jgi:hypothetical protein